MADDQPAHTSLFDLGRSLIGALPPVFLMLVLMNIAFISLVMWFLDHELGVRMQMLMKVLDHCLVEK